MNNALEKYSTDALKKEIRLRTGLEYLVNKIRDINYVQEELEKILVARRLLDAKCQELHRTGSYEGHFPVVPEADQLIKDFKDLVYSSL